MSCFQCDLDIAHVCYVGMLRARWGWTDEPLVTLEAAPRLLSSVRPSPALEGQGALLQSGMHGARR
jgi:hypothetical protein